MAPSFLSKFVKSSPNSHSSQSSQRSRSPSPSPSSNHLPPSITINSGSPTGTRPRRHTTVGSSSPSFDASTESFPNVTVVPPSPRSTNYGSDITDDDPTPKSTQSPTTFSSNGSARRVPSLSNLPSLSSADRVIDDGGLTTPTPATTHSTFSEKSMVQQQTSLKPSRSHGNLRQRSPSPDSRARDAKHPRAATVSEQPQNSLSRTPSRKSTKGSKSRKTDSPSQQTSHNRHDRSASVPSIPVNPPYVSVTEDGVLTSSPTSEVPPMPSATSSNYSNKTMPSISSHLLAPDNSDASSMYSVSSTATSSKKKRGWSRKSSNPPNNEQPSTSPAMSTISLSPKRKTTGGGLAQAIAVSGLAMANPISGMTPAELPPTPGTSSSLSSRPRRSSSFSRNGRPRQSSIGYPASDFSDRDSYHSGQDLLDDHSGLDDDDDDDLDLDPDDIPVTGFAVASNKRNQDFHELFPTVPEGDYLIEDYGCALQREILIQGRLYVSENHICFHANIFGWVTDLCIAMYEVTALDKRMTAFVIPNAIQVTTTSAKYTFTSFLSRDNTFDVIYNVWRLARPEGSPMGSQIQSRRGSLDILDGSDGISVGVPSASSAGEKVQVKSKVTQCACGKAGEHFTELAMETVLPGTPEKIYNLMFTSGFIKDFMTQEQRLTDLQISDWMPTADNPKLLYRQMSYIKPLTGSIGPKQAKCELRDETVHCDFDDYIVMLTTTRTPDVPSGGVFSVKTKTCITWASSVSTKVVVTTQVEWSGRSFIKGLIEKSAIDGQKQYHADLDKSMRSYIHAHQSEFIPEGMDVSVVEEAEAQTVESSPRLSAERPSLSDTEPRKKSREYEHGQRGLQWAYDTFEGTLKVAKQSTEGLLELIKDAWDQSTSTTILYFIIAFLVLSNIWTLVMVGRREEAGRRKAIRKTEEREQWVQGIVTALWEELVASKTTAGETALAPSPRPLGDWQGEVSDIHSALDYIERRVQHIREGLAELD